MTEHLINYRGSISGLSAHGSTLVFTTKHWEGQPTAVFQYDLTKKKLQTTELDCGVTAQAVVGDTIWLAGTDRVLRSGPLGKKVKAVPGTFDNDIVAIGTYSGGVTVVEGNALHLVTAKGIQATFDLEEPGTTVTSDATGKWLVAGTTRGHVVIFNDDGGFKQTARERLHDGEVTALAFSPDELRFFSTGSDCRLLVSFARGAFDTEDRSKGNAHTKASYSILIGPTFETPDGNRERLYTAGLDGAIKSWPRGRGGSQRPATMADGVVKTTHLAIVELDGKPHLAAAGRDATIRVFAFDEDGKVENRVAIVRDAYALAANQLQSAKPKERGSALADLAAFGDQNALRAIAKHVASESDHKLQVAGVELIAKMKHDQSAANLEGFLAHQAADVRVAAYKGLRGLKSDDLGVVKQALDTGLEDIGLLAIADAQAFGTPAAVNLLRETLNVSNSKVRMDALMALERHYGNNPEGTLAGLKSTQKNIRSTAILRLQRRGFVGTPLIDARLRRLWDDDDARARYWAFVALMHRRPNLVKALRAVDEEFHAKTFRLERYGKKGAADKAVPAAKAFDPKKLSQDDFRPLLEAMGSRSIDICLHGALGLAALGDERSFGTLLQLSRESDANARVQVCKGLQVLGDARSTDRVRAMLHDTDSTVRDAAFTALAALQTHAPLQTARDGLQVSHSDVRERALANLVVTLKKSKKLSDEARELLVTALNDADAGIRREAFKSVLTLAPDGGGVPTLRFILQSVHADIRNEVLQEAKPHPKDADYRGIVLTMVDDADKANRNEAFDHGLERWPSAEVKGLFEAALSSGHVGQRIAAVRKLSSRKDDLRSMLVGALDDTVVEVRLEAVRALVAAENKSLLADALKSEHLDVRIEAAAALAALGDSRALAPLLEVLSKFQLLTDAKAEGEEIQAYRRSLKVALAGVTRLGHPDAMATVVALFEGDADVVAMAAATLPAIAHPSNLDLVRAAAKHESEKVRISASLALAYNGDESGATLVWSKASATQSLLAALGLRGRGTDRVMRFVDSGDRNLRHSALLIALALELSEHVTHGLPDRCLSMLSSTTSETRLIAAQGLELYGSQPEFYRWVYATMNGLKSQPDAWQADANTLLSLSRAVTFGEPRLAVQAATILTYLLDAKSERFDRQYQLFSERSADLLASLERQANQETPSDERIASAWQRLKAKAKSIVVKPTSFEESLQILAFGAYIGISRQNDQQTPHTARVSAIVGLGRLVEAREAFRADAISVLLLTLGDPIQAVREKAFDALQALGTADNVLSTEALSTGIPDMGFRGLQLMSADPKSGTALLEQTLLESENGLELEAAKLLAERIGWVGVHSMGVGAASEGFRANSVRGLSAQYFADEKAVDALRVALTSRFEDTRFLAATQLAAKKDDAAFDVLCEMINSEDTSLHWRAIEGMQKLQHKDAPTALLDRIEFGADGAALDQFFDAAVSFGDAAIADRLIGFVDADKNRQLAFEAALELSGFKQYDWTEDEDVTEAWEKSLKPRLSELFAQIMDLAYRIADPSLLGETIGLAKWPEVHSGLDRTLSALLGISQENVRHRAVEIVGWRLRHREGPSDGLVAALSGKDPLDQFYAAEGLGLAGHAEGLVVLRTAIDAMDDYSLRERAVLALGQLADPSTVESLLSFANDEEHALQEPAAEAIGHMSATEQADEVFATLKRLSADGSGTQESALKGLRWFGSPGAWDILRHRAQGDNWWVAQQCVELLRFDDASRDVVADVLRANDDWDVANAAVTSLRHMWGPESLEPDYLLLEACVGGLEHEDEAMERLRKDGDAERILQALPRVHEDNVGELVPPLVAILLSRDPLPLEAAANMLASDKSRTVDVAAQILGRGKGGDTAKYTKKVTTALVSTHEAWMTAWADFQAHKTNARSRLSDLGVSYRRLVWAAGQLEIGASQIVAAAKLPDHEQALPIRENAVNCLGESWIGSAGVSTLVELATGHDARLRSMAAAELDRAAPKESQKLLDGALSDHVSFGRLIQSLDDKTVSAALRKAVGTAAGIALPRMVMLKDIEGLAAAMENGTLEDTTRRGAIDALAQIPTDGVAKKLAEFGADNKQDELLRKAAWRARRRVVRAVAAQQEAP